MMRMIGSMLSKHLASMVSRSSSSKIQTMSGCCQLVSRSPTGLLDNNTRIDGHQVSQGSTRIQFRTISLSRQRNDIFKIQDEDDFQEKVIRSNLPVIVDFYATWCGPCKLLGPRLETIIGSQGGKVNLAVVDVDVLEKIAVEYNVTAMPTVIGIKDGMTIDSFIGLKDEDEIRSFVQKVIDS